MQVVQPRQRDTEAVVFTWRENVQLRHWRQVLPAGVTRVIVHPNEASMLQGWLAWLHQADPDILNVFQAGPLCDQSKPARLAFDAPVRHGKAVEISILSLIKHIA